MLLWPSAAELRRFSHVWKQRLGKAELGGGPTGNRTRVQGFAVLCVTTPPSGRSSSGEAALRSGTRSGMCAGPLRLSTVGLAVRERTELSGNGRSGVPKQMSLEVVALAWLLLLFQKKMGETLCLACQSVLVRS